MTLPRTVFRQIPLMALTQDHLALGHLEQARQLCAAGVRWIQLRMKAATPDELLATAAEVVAVCHAAGALCTINDHVDVAVVVGADGAHVGRLDLGWAETRRRLGPARLLGGTVNDATDASRAVRSGCLDYVGVGPLRYTANKRNLAPLLGLAGIQNLMTHLGGLPAWVIGGVRPEDVPGVRGIGAAGVAVSGALVQSADIAAAVRAFLGGVPARPEPSSTSLSP